MTLVTALRVLSWVAILGVLSVALCTHSAERPDWCPLGVNPQSCVTRS